MNLILFKNIVHMEHDDSWLNNLNTYCEKYIEEAKESDIKFYGKEYGIVHHSKFLNEDEKFYDFLKFVLKKSYIFLDEQGYKLNDFNLVVREFWVQEFSLLGGGFNYPHVHPEGHVSGFYFLKCSPKTSRPVFLDPRPGKLMLQLPEKDITKNTEATEKAFINVIPGNLILFNSFLPHEFPIDSGKDPFRFIHFNIQAIPKHLFNNNIKSI